MSTALTGATERLQRQKALLRGVSVREPGAGELRLITDSIHEIYEPFESVESADLDGLMARIGDAKVVLLGEATHGTSEFYRMRARITQRLVQEKGFTIVAAEADWPDASVVRRYVRSHGDQPNREPIFMRFPTWMWRNKEVYGLFDWMRAYNDRAPADQYVGFYGLDLYSMYTSIDHVLSYLKRLDKGLYELGKQRFGCLAPWRDEPQEYGMMAATTQYHSCEKAVVSMLQELLKARLEQVASDGENFFDAVQNARLVVDAERYYRSMYSSYASSWNVRDQHMFDNLKHVLAHRGPSAKAVVWAHNSHLGNAMYTEMADRGELNVGQLCREEFGAACYAVGFGTDRGKVAAATEWDGNMELKSIVPSRRDSYERICHTARAGNFFLPLRQASRARELLMVPRLERAIGVIYRPDTEFYSHYFKTILPMQFDEMIWIDDSNPVQAIHPELHRGAPDTYPFGL